MICEKCGASIPAGRDACINCGAPVSKPDWVEEIEKTSEVMVEDQSFKGKNRAEYYGTAAATVILGMVGALLLYLRFPFLPGLIFASILILVICPIAGMILVTAGLYRTGCVFTCIGAFTAFPIGIAGRRSLFALWNFGYETKDMIKSGERSFIKDGMVIKPPLPLSIGVIALVVLLILAPVVSYMFIMNRPMIQITSYHVPSQYNTPGSVEVKVTLYSFGHQTAEGEKIQVKIEGSGAGMLDWGEGDLGTMSSKTGRFSVQTSGRLSNIVVYYDGEKVDEQEIEGLWIPTYG